MPVRFIRLASIVAATLFTWLLSPSTAQSQTFTWIGTATGNWSTSTNWLDGNVPSATGMTTAIILQTFGNQPAITVTNDITSGGQFNVNSITFQGSATGSINLIQVASNVLNFNGSNAAIIQNGAIGLSFANNNGATINLSSDIRISGGGRGGISLNSIIPGKRQIIVNYAQPLPGMGPVTFSSTGNTWTGGVTLQAGNLFVSNTTSLGSGNLTITGSDTTVTAGSGFGNNIVLNANGTIFSSGGTFTGNITEDATPRNFSVTAGSAIAPAVFQGANTYSGTTFVGASPVLRTTGSTAARK